LRQDIVFYGLDRTRSKKEPFIIGPYTLVFRVDPNDKGLLDRYT